MTAIPAGEISGVVLAGGRGSRMGGLDKGLQPHLGVPLARHALERLRPQVGPLMVNANRHLDAYAAFGVPVRPDALPDFGGPLAGILVALAHCTTPWLAVVPCDTPGFPPDLVARLAEGALARQADLAMPATATARGTSAATAATAAAVGLQLQPAFCLIRVGLRDDLARYCDEGGRSIHGWAARLQAAQVFFDDTAAFFNVNTLAELDRLQHAGP